MATPSTLRPLVLCVSSLLCGVLAHAATSPARTAQPPSWFDQQLDTKAQSLQTHGNKHEQREQLIALALLDQIYELREYVSDPSQVDSLVKQFESDTAATSAVQQEARALMACTTGGRDERSSNKAVRAVLESVAEIADGDSEVLNAVAAISLFHDWDRAKAQSAAELTHSAESWYRASRAATDGYRRIQALHRALEADASYVPAVLDLARQYAAQGRRTLSRSLLIAALEKNPQETSLLELLAETEANQGRGSAALATMNDLRTKRLSIAVARGLAEVYAQMGFLNEGRGLAHYALNLGPTGVHDRDQTLRLDELAGDRKAIAEDHGRIGTLSVDELPEALATPDADSERLRRLLQGESVAHEDGSRTFFSDISDLIKAWRALPAALHNESRTLAETRVDELRTDYQATQHVQQVIAIGSPADIATYHARSIQYSPQSQTLTISRARLHHADGHTVDGDDLGDTSVADISVSMYYDLRARQLRFRDLRIGDVVELEYTLAPMGRENPYGAYFAQLVAFGGPLKCDLQRYILRVPAAIQVSSAEHLVDPSSVRHERGGSIYTWEKKDIAGLIREPRSPSWSEQGAYVHVSSFDSWQALGKWYAELIRPQFKLNAELDKVVSGIVARHPNRLDRVAVIDELVLKTTRYVALEFGVYGFKPYPVTQTFARRFGDCKDKASLLVALLRAAGIDADFALVRTRLLGDIISQPASASIFDHAIVYVPEFNLWLDGTAEYSRLRELPVDDQGAMALTIDADGNSFLRRTPISSAGDNYSRRTIDARVESDGTIHFSGATYVRGEDAPGLRRELEPHDAKVAYVRDRLAQVLPAVEVRDVQLPRTPSESVSLNFNGDLSTFKGCRSATLPSSWMERNYVESLAARSSRNQELRLEAPWTTAEEIHIQLPPGAHLRSLPKNQTIRTHFGKAELEYQLQGSELTVLSTVQFIETQVPASQYAEFREFAANVEDAFHRNIEVELP